MGWKPLGERMRDNERIFVVEAMNNKVLWEKQTSMMEFFKEVGYADLEKKVEWGLPAHGQAYKDCGSVKVKGCDNVEKHNHGKVFGRIFKRNCMRKECPVCMEGWASGEAERSLVRMASFVVGSDEVEKVLRDLRVVNSKNPPQIFHRDVVEDLESMIKEYRLKPIHLVLSPPEKEYSMFEDPSAYRKTREKAYKIAKISGFKGGAMIIHPYRLKCPTCGIAIPEYQKVCLKCGGSTFKWFFSPHFHFVGFGWIENAKELYARFGWVVKNLGVRKNVFWTFQYLLSHAGVSNSGFHTTTWFGDLAYNVLRHVAVLKRPLELCPYCGNALRPLQWIKAGSDPPKLEFSKKDPQKNDFLGDFAEWRRF